jgi:hypothetical protein
VAGYIGTTPCILHRRKFSNSGSVEQKNILAIFTCSCRVLKGNLLYLRLKHQMLYSFKNLVEKPTHNKEIPIQKS